MCFKTPLNSNEDTTMYLDTDLRTAHQFAMAHAPASHNPNGFVRAARRARALAADHGIQIDEVASSEDRRGAAVFVWPPAALDNPASDPYYGDNCARDWIDAANRVDDYVRLLTEYDA